MRKGNVKTMQAIVITKNLPDDFDIEHTYALVDWVDQKNFLQSTSAEYVRPMTDVIPTEWIKDYITHIKRLDLEYEPNTCSLDDVVKEEMERMIDTYLEEEVAD